MKTLTFGIRLDITILSFLINLLSLAVPIVLLQVYDRILPNSALSTAALLFLGAIVALVIEGIFRFMRTYILSLYGEFFEYSSALLAMRKLFECDLAQALNMGSGALKQRLADIASMREHYSGQTLLVMFDLPFTLLFLGAIWYIGGNLVFVPLTIYVVAILSTMIAGRSLRTASRKTSETDDDRMNFITNILNTLSSIKCLGGERLMLRIFRHKSQSLIVERTRLDRLGHTISDCISLLGGLTTIATVVVGALFVMDGQLTTGGLAACTILAGRSLSPVVALMGLWPHLQRIWVARDRVDEFWELEEDHTFSVDSELAPEDGSIVMKDAQVSRGDNLYTFNMDIPSGSKFMLSNSMGASLPMFMGLLIGSRQPDKGQVLVGNYPLPNYARNTYRRAVAFVTRRSQVFRGSIMDNLTLYQPSRELKAIELSHQVGLTKFIHSMPNGFRTQVGDVVGGPLEMGTIQRMAIVRALTQDPVLLFLNEADEGIDLAGKQLLAQMLQKVEGPTILLLPTDSTLRTVFEHSLKLDEHCTVTVKSEAMEVVA
ncbi:ABC transporter transmembrane domain-containing protein [Pseudodesulfovibrio piezophilus]|uniref:Putative ABC-type protease/lipase transport system, ATPase and permease components n=1 Tax=Pseudodesulfovibrio piezophilus (strain DSM 21447 / JCM 15486 / C1TLV30) TaxID=1322246 RepID=M1WW36_PSEP2|nr:ABC transporter transmembrane domain-containing protein [Pseudodesulfovibrio piezophilus]CCH48893.1 putative ABC-type protease/lipase transport system, ATPase and permease components [Pseudodesulfovibrio piezophilus C1TLV30]